jgi:YHS domain-containing protein
MSFETILLLALFAGAFVLMIRRGGGGCGGHAFGHGHNHHASGSDSTHGAGGGMTFLSAHQETDPGHDHSHSSSGTVVTAGGAPSLSADQDVDPVCGMTVENATAKSAVYQGQAYYFCSQSCRDKFEAAPAAYAKALATPAAVQQSSRHHGCC